MYHSKDIRHKSLYEDVMPFLPIYFIMVLRSKKVEKTNSSEHINFVVFSSRYIVMDKPSFVPFAFYFLMLFLVATMYGYNGFFCHHDHDDDDHVRRVCD